MGNLLLIFHFSLLISHFSFLIFHFLLLTFPFSFLIPSPSSSLKIQEAPMEMLPRCGHPWVLLGICMLEVQISSKSTYSPSSFEKILPSALRLRVWLSRVWLCCS